MAGKNKNKVGRKQTNEIGRDQKQYKKHYIGRLKELVMLIGGQPLMKEFHSVYFEYLYEKRYPLWKVKAAPDSGDIKPAISIFNLILKKSTEKRSIALPNGSAIPMNIFMHEGQQLFDFARGIDCKQHPHLASIKSYFNDYLEDGTIYKSFLDQLYSAINNINSIISAYTDTIFKADFSNTPYFNDFNGLNEILLYAYRPEVVKIETERGMRNAIRYGWINKDYKWNISSVRPSLLGFPTKAMDIPLNLYITVHAFNRLKERISTFTGLIHHNIPLTFERKKIDHVFSDNVSFVDFKVNNIKVGYLIVKKHGDKLVVHTFLFLTNNNTPEGKKLEKLLQLQKEDKMYLGIDKLSTFNAYNFHQNEKLSKAFIACGCGDLLELRHLKIFDTADTKDRDANMVADYIAYADYFNKEYTG